MSVSSGATPLGAQPAVPGQGPAARPDPAVEARPDPAAGQPDPEAKPPSSRWHLVLRIAALLVVAVIVAAVLRSKFPAPSQFWNALRSADWRWTLGAFALQMASIGMMIRQQRRLLMAFGVPMSYRRMGAITYSGSAISMSVPAGGAVSAGYMYRKFRASGASSGTAASVLLLSGVISVSALVLLYLIGLLITSWTQLRRLGTDHPFITVWIGGAVLVAIIAATVWLTRQRRRSLDARSTPRVDAFEERHPKLGAAGRQVLDAVHRSARVPVWDWNLILTQSLANWLLDAASLYAATKAFDLNIDLWKLALLYLGIQVVRQIPVTPGGIGLIEASLLAGLVSAGAPQGAAAAAVVVYRLFACWLLIPIGFAMMGLLELSDRRNGVTAPADDPGDDPSAADRADRS